VREIRMLGGNEVQRKKFVTSVARHIRGAGSSRSPRKRPKLRSVTRMKS